jgi:hypothetical protein
MPRHPARKATRFVPLALLAGALLAGGCLSAAPEPGEGAVYGTAQVDLVVTGRVVQAARIEAARPGDDAKPEPGKALRWELKDVSGEVVGSGEAVDPRFVRAEFDEQGDHGDGGEARGSAGMLSVRVPGSGGELTLFEPDGAGWRAIGSVRVPALDPDVASSQSALIDPSTDVIGEPVAVVDHGDPAQRANVLIVPEGYTEAELGKFHTDVDHMLATVSSVAVYQKYWDAFNFYRQDIRSAQSGIADPALGTDPVTAFEMSFGVDGTATPRRCVFYGGDVEAKILASLQGVAGKVRADAIVFLVNTAEYGGCAAPWNKVVTVTKHDQSPLILAHELGHSLFKLADEYGGGTSCDLTVQSPNVSAKLSALPWADMLTTSQVPTPDSAAAGTIGAFDGASYCDHGIYRPQHTCLMRELNAEMCPVCTREVERFFDARGYGGGGQPPAGGGQQAGEVEVRNETGFGLFVRCPNTVGAGCSDWTYFTPGATLRLDTNAEGNALYIDNSTVGEVAVPYSWRLIKPGAASAVIYANTDDPLSPP